MPSHGSAKERSCPGDSGSGLQHLCLPAPCSQALSPPVVAALHGGHSCALTAASPALPLPSPVPLGNHLAPSSSLAQSTKR